MPPSSGRQEQTKSQTTTTGDNGWRDRTTPATETNTIDSEESCRTTEYRTGAYTD